MDRDKRIKYVGKIFLILGFFFCIPFSLLLLFPSDPSSEFSGWAPLLITAYLCFGPGLLGLGVFFQLVGRFLTHQRPILALVNYCSNCNLKSSTKQPELILCSSCNQLMELGIQCKNCSRWFYTTQLGRNQCPQCKAVIII